MWFTANWVKGSSLTGHLSKYFHQNKKRYVYTQDSRWECCEISSAYFMIISDSWSLFCSLAASHRAVERNKMMCWAIKNEMICGARTSRKAIDLRATGLRQIINFELCELMRSSDLFSELDVGIVNSLVETGACWSVPRTVQWLERIKNF